MKRILPDRVHLVIFAAIAVLCAVLQLRSEKPDVGLMVLSFPVALVCGLMGAQRTGQLAEAPQEDDISKLKREK